MKFTRIMAAAAVCLTFASTAQAQTQCTSAAKFVTVDACTALNTVDVTVGYVARLTLTSATTGLTAPTAINFGDVAGVTNSNALSLDVKANANWAITASAASANWTGGGNNKPAGDLKVATNQVASTQLTTAGIAVGSGSAHAGTTLQISYNVIYGWTIDIPGSYSLGINYTLTSP